MSCCLFLAFASAPDYAVGRSKSEHYLDLLRGDGDGRNRRCEGESAEEVGFVAAGQLWDRPESRNLRTAF